MWYLIVLALSACSNLWAMDDTYGCDGEKLKGIVYRDKPVTENGRHFLDNRDTLFEIAMEYHDERLSTSLAEEAALHASCKAYLNAHKNTVALAIAANGNSIVHGFENKMIEIDYVHKEPAEIFETTDDSNQKPNTTLEFTSCSIYKRYPPNPTNKKCYTHILAVDNAHNIHSWDDIYYRDWKTIIPGMVTAIRQLNSHVAAVFYHGNDNAHHVGFALESLSWDDAQKKFRVFFLPVEEIEGVTNLQWRELRDLQYIDGVHQCY